MVCRRFLETTEVKIIMKLDSDDAYIKNCNFLKYKFLLQSLWWEKCRAAVLALPTNSFMENSLAFVFQF